MSLIFVAKGIEGRLAKYPETVVRLGAIFKHVCKDTLFCPKSQTIPALNEPLFVDEADRLFDGRQSEKLRIGLGEGQLDQLLHIVQTFADVRL